GHRDPGPQAQPGMLNSHRESCRASGGLQPGTFTQALPAGSSHEAVLDAPDLGSSRVERVTRIELALSAWEADVLPLNYTREPCRRAGILARPADRDLPRYATGSASGSTPRSGPAARLPRRAPLFRPEPVSCQRAAL